MCPGSAVSAAKRLCRGRASDGPGAEVSAWSAVVSAVRSSNGVAAVYRLPRVPVSITWAGRARQPDPRQIRPDTGDLPGGGCPELGQSEFLEPVADAVERFDHIEVVVDRLELLAQPLHVAVAGSGC